VDNVLRFLMHPHTTYVVELNQSYRNQKIASKLSFQPKARNKYGVRAHHELASEPSCWDHLVRMKYGS
jgi:hypothetical protein